MDNYQKNIEIKIVNKWPSDQIIDLYKAGGWWKESYDPSGIEPLIKGSFVFAIIFDKQKNIAVGMGRIISDGVSDAYLQDIILLPEYRGKRLGKKLVNFLINHCKSKGITWIALIAEPNQDEFYKPSGFKTMNDYVPMKYQQGD